MQKIENKLSTMPDTQTKSGSPCYLVLELKDKDLRPYGNELNIYKDFKVARLAYTKAVISTIGRSKTIFMIECKVIDFLKFKLKEVCFSYNIPIGYILPMEVLDLYDYSLDALIDGLNR